MNIRFALNISCTYCGGLGFLIPAINEFIQLILSLAIALLFGSYLLRQTSKSEQLRDFLSQSLGKYLLLIIPILYYLARTWFGGSPIYNRFNHPSVYVYLDVVILAMTGYICFLMVEYYQMSGSTDPKSVIAYLRQRTPYILNAFFIIIFYLSLPFSPKLFITEVDNIIVQTFGATKETEFFIGGYMIWFLTELLALQLIMSVILAFLPSGDEPELMQVQVSGWRKFGFLVFILALVVFWLMVRILFAFQLVAQFGFIRNPFTPNFLTVNSAPSALNFFGTDENGRDIFAQILFSFGTAAILLVGVGLLRHVSAIILYTIMKRLNPLISSTIRGWLWGIQSVPLLILLSMAILSENELQTILIAFAITSVFAVADSIDLMERSDYRPSRGIITDPLLSRLMSNIILELTLFAYIFLPYLKTLGRYVEANSNLYLGGLIATMYQPDPFQFWWRWAFALLTIVGFTALLRPTILQAKPRSLLAPKKE